MVEQLSSLHAFHHNVHILQGFEVFFHNNDVRMVQVAYDLDLFSQEFPFPWRELFFVNKLLSEEFISLLRPAEIHSAKLAFAELMESLVLLGDVEEAGLLFYEGHPLINNLWVLVVVDSCLEVVRVVEVAQALYPL